ncbi:hypothetical protein B0T14DRAFT_243658 [Immersiella caudata]|uniref:C2H2-type domain-containing protein n=1 Tax=Immersiella caudata TaxID=314043 RepID=A0AA39WJ51_9PEZI|nr:hypothetical protein B0T14DRAFT_243658 [Immersiella caudata]
MASLKFIMDVNDDHQTDGRHANKKDATPANAGQLQLQLLQEPTSAPPHSGHVSSSSGLVVEHQNNITQAVPSPQTTTSNNNNKRRGVSTQGPKPTNTPPAPLSSSSAANPSISSESSSLSAPASTSRPPARRRSTASVDSMDHTGYGSAASSSSMGHGLHPNQPMRPMPPHPQGSEIPMRLTPITGRVSRAKKGVPVHVCDLCKPAKTFTRAEHLRRHQLSHQNPGYACTYPGCERAFHRPDLLARHQQRHEVEGDKASKSGGNEGDRRASSARSSMDDGYRGGQLQQSSSGSSSAMAGAGAGPMGSSSAADISSTPNASGDQRRFSQMSNSTTGGSPATPRALGGGGASTYRSSGSASRDYNSYPMPSSTVSIIDPTHPSTMTGGYPGVLDYQTPRTASQSMNIMSTLPTLLIPEQNKTPELSYAHDGASPWTSSASDSTYSTPASDIPRRVWMRPRSPTADWQSNHHQLLSPYPGSAPRNLQNPAGGLDAMPSMYVNNQYSTSSYTHTPAPQQPSYYDVSMNPYGSAAGPGQHGTYRSHHQHNTSISSLSSPVQASNTSSSHSGDTLIAPAAHPGRLDPLVGLGRQKELAMGTHQSLMDAQAMGDLGVLDGMNVGYGALDGSRSTGDNEGAILTTLDLPMGGGCSMQRAGMGLPLQGTVRASVPSYLDVYWDRVHPVLPVVHRQSFEAAPEDALRCAMAAVATQYLNSKEDRTRGNQLHEFAWHEAKRVTSWNLQTMQAILLLEYFARFRGRKAVTKPSKLFESLYSRVSALQFFTASSSLPLGSRDPTMPWLIDTSDWSPASSPPSDCSSCASITPTAAAVGLSYTQVPAHAVPTNTTPWDSFPSSYASSTSSAFGGIPSSPISFHPEDPFPHNTITTPAAFNVNVAPPITTNTNTSTGAQRSWSSLFSPGRYNPPLASSLSFRTRSSHVAEHTYSQALSTLQVLYHDPAMFNNTVLDADPHLSTEERWRSWLDTEARRRLLAACFHLDGHAAIYQQQLRAHDFDTDGMTPISPVPLFARSEELWNAVSADEWAAILAAFPEKGIPLFAPPSEQLTPELVMSRTPHDRMAILGIEMLRLPRRQLVAATSSVHSSPIPGEAQLPMDPQLQNYGNQQSTSCAQEPLDLSVEEHISKLFAKCPIGNTYLALHHTPLQDLLAVGGDSWVFSQKVLPATSFLEHQKRLKLWTEQHSRPSLPSNADNAGISNLSAARATVYAARAILLFLERGPGSSWSMDLSDYWALYVCALICWAFGHRARPAPTSDARHHGHHQRNGSGGSISSMPASRLPPSAAKAGDEEAVGWLRMVAAEGMRLEDVIRLEGDCVGGRSRLYVDAVGVLRKLDEGANWKWF